MPAYLTSGGRIVQMDEAMASKFVDEGSYTLATPQDIIFDNIRKGLVPEDYLRVHFPYWDNVSPVFGYGTGAYSIIKYALEHKIALQTGSYTGQKVAIIYKTVAGKYLGDKTFSHLKQYYNQFTDTNRPKILMYTMWETTKLPEVQVEYLNKYADGVIVPSQWNIDFMKASGVKKPIYLIPHGVGDDFTYYDRPDNFENFQFLHYNAGEERKSYREIIQAFCNEFQKGEKVKLVLKTTNKPAPIWEELQKNEVKNEIEMISKMGSREELNQLCHKSHCFVFPSKGEGYGLTPVEAVKTGLCAIVPKAHGFLDTWNEAYLPVDSKLTPADYGQEYYTDQSDMGQWYSPEVASIQKQMRFAFENWPKIKKFGQKGAKQVADKYNWATVLEELPKIIKNYV